MANIPIRILYFCLQDNLSLKKKIPTSVDKIIDPPEYVGNKNVPSIVEIA